jgi:hypothetical protein
MMVIKFVRLRWVAGCAWGRELVLQLGRILNRTRGSIPLQVTLVGESRLYSYKDFFFESNKNWKFDIRNPCTYLFKFEN